MIHLIDRDARLREFDYGKLTQCPTEELALKTRIHEPFPDGENGEVIVDPPVVELPGLEPGAVFDIGVSITVLPVCIRPHEIDVVASNADVKVENHSGIQTNGCGGDVSNFELTIAADAFLPEFELLFVDGESILGSIPVVIHDLPGGGAEDGYLVSAEPGVVFEGLSLRAAARECGVSLHRVRQRMQIVRALARV